MTRLIFLLFLFCTSCPSEGQNYIKPTDNSLCSGYDPDTNVYDYGPDYAAGPYGFKGHVCWINEDTIEYSFTTSADTIHNVCLSDAKGNNHCLKDYFGSKTYDFIIVNISDYYCGPCRAAASDQKSFMEHLKKSGYKVLWITILDGATSVEAVEWKNGYRLNGMVLSDPGSSWLSKFHQDAWQNEVRGVPTFFIVNTSDMKIWFSIVGWPMEKSELKDWHNQFNILIEYVRSKI
jgi:hypothetical protein